MKKIIKSSIPPLLFIMYLLIFKFIILAVTIPKPLRFIVGVIFGAPLVTLYFSWTPLMIKIGFVEGGTGWFANFLDYRAYIFITIFYVVFLYLVTFRILTRIEKRKKARSDVANNQKM